MPPAGPGYPWPAPPDPAARRASSTRLLRVAGFLLIIAVAGAVIGGWLVAGIFRTQPPADTQFGSGRSIAVDFAAGEAKTIYTRSNEAAHPIRCSATSPRPGRGIAMTPVGPEITINGWRAGVTTRAEQPGTYTITCTGSPNDTFGVGAPMSVVRLGAPLAVVAAAALAGVAALVTGLIGISTRRRVLD